MGNSATLFLFLGISWALGISTVSLVLFFIKPKNRLVFKRKEVLLHLLFCFLTFLVIGAIAYTMAFIIAPEQWKDCSSLVCKIVKINRLEVSRDFGIISGLLAEFIISLVLSMKFFLKPILTNFDSEPE